MRKLKIFGFVMFLGFLMTFGSEVGERLSIPGAQHLTPTAEARVGRPLTPVSVGGVARRSTRRTVRHVAVAAPAAAAPAPAAPAPAAPAPVAPAPVAPAPVAPALRIVTQK